MDNQLGKLKDTDIDNTDTLRGVDVKLIKDNLEKCLYHYTKSGRVSLKDMADINSLINRLAIAHSKKVNESLK